MRIIVLSLLICISAPGIQAKEKWWLVAGGWSYHTSARDYKYDWKNKLNETHESIGFEYEKITNGDIYSVEAVTFLNSYHDRSVAFLAGRKWDYWYGGLGVKIGAATGYKEKKFYNIYHKKRRINNGNNGVLFLAMPFYTIDLGRLRGDFAFVPRSGADRTSSHVFIFTAKILL